MAKLSAREIVDAVKEMTVLEVKEIVDLMKEELGVDPSAVAVAAAPVAGAAAEEEASSATIVLKDCGANKLAVIKLIKEVTGLGLGEAKAIADNGGNVKENVAMDEAKDLKAKFEEAGATIELQ